MINVAVSCGYAIENGVIVAEFSENSENMFLCVCAACVPSAALCIWLCCHQNIMAEIFINVPVPRQSYRYIVGKSPDQKIDPGMKNEKSNSVFPGKHCRDAR